MARKKKEVRFQGKETPAEEAKERGIMESMTRKVVREPKRGKRKARRAHRG